jgi:hypothetical protein
MISVRRAVLYIFAVVGVIASVVAGVGLALDIGSFDRTRGGYEPPYTDFTGTPIDFSQLDQTATGMAYRGYVVNTLIDCRRGMIAFEVFKRQIRWRAFSPRAIAVHQPREACEARGFTPRF